MVALEGHAALVGGRVMVQWIRREKEDNEFRYVFHEKLALKVPEITER